MTVTMLQARSLVALDGIRHGFFTRTGGVSQGVYATLNGGVGSSDAPDKVRENRARMAAALGVAPERLVSLYQIHSPNVVLADNPWPPDQRPHADGIVTRTPGLAIGISTADCGPVLFADRRARVIGAAHAGWKGALTGVLEATIETMESAGADRSGIRAALGPMIRQPSYEVGPEFVERFRNDDAASVRFFKPAARAGHAMFDLAGYIAARLTRAGINHFEDLGFCTFAEPDRFFSYRRTTKLAEPDYGRHVNAIALSN